MFSAYILRLLLRAGRWIYLSRFGGDVSHSGAVGSSKIVDSTSATAEAPDVNGMGPHLRVAVFGVPYQCSHDRKYWT
jgi:hypothetical protein